MFRKVKKRHSSSSSQSSEISTKSKSVDSSLGGLSRSSTVASLDTDSTKSSNEEMILGVSKYGVKVASLDQCDVLHRHPLYLIVRMLCYDDGLGAGKNLLALKTTDAEQQECSIWVYQCSSAEQAQAICKVLSTSFDCALASEKS
ncbi:Integrin beta-1-binding protein 1 [Labeo rohita]|uniref:Integrin beta-1-binding protein 1 n=1 Tax=Labeo rohita TaxID=84645 RepID=A0ABQ8LV60_LABRO|nr:Integrin beta-1-binding protein 1 [Labeo rohita]